MRELLKELEQAINKVGAKTREQTKQATTEMGNFIDNDKYNKDHKVFKETRQVEEIVTRLRVQYNDLKAIIELNEINHKGEL